jgi:tRNA(His) 5'-end guanylyltransferase
MDISDRQKRYEDASDIILTTRLPVIIRVDGKSFHKVCKKVIKPYDPLVIDCMANAMLSSIESIEGAVFGYQQSDEITFVLRNDQNLESQPWFKNRIQKISSITSSLITYHFNKYFSSLKDPPNLIGDLLFDARSFIVPSINESVNNLIWRQLDCIRNAITNASYHELGKKFGKKTAQGMIQNKKVDERLILLSKDCGIDFEDKYPVSYKRGVCVYKVPTIVNSSNGEIARNKWKLDYDTPLFVQNRTFLQTIISNGHDIYRQENIVSSQ